MNTPLDASFPPDSYRPRIADGLLSAALQRAGAVQILGPKWCGKTTTAAQIARSTIFFQDPDTREANLRIAMDKPSLLLQGNRPLLLDEWQDAPMMWDAVRFAVDKNNAVGQFILTGSTAAKSDDIRHSGTGRFARVRMRAMSLYESGESDGSISLESLVKSEEVEGHSSLNLEDVAWLIARGGWPAAVTRTDYQTANVISLATDYVESIIESDSSRVDGIEKNPRRVRLLMRSLARNESSEAAMTTLQADMATDDGKVSTNTIAIYLNALRRLYVVEEQEAWAPAVRAKTPIRTSPVRRYCDPSIPTALLRFTPDKMLVDFNTFGLLFESLCIRDLRTYAEAIDASVWHYRDARGLECDAIIEFGDGTWGAIEIKLQSSQVEKAAANLHKINKLVRSQHGGPASFLAVLTAGGTGYRRPDGIYLIPIGCLKS
jgi:predicted AAA+ superfamily ATPase